MLTISDDGKTTTILPLYAKVFDPISIEEGKELRVWEKTETLFLHSSLTFLFSFYKNVIWKRTKSLGDSCFYFCCLDSHYKHFPVLIHISCLSCKKCPFVSGYDKFLSFNRSKLESYIWLQYSLKVRCPTWDKNLIKYLCEFVIYWE